MKHHLATLFGWRQPRRLPAQMMQMHVTLLMADGTVTAQDVQVPDTTPLSGMIRTVAIQLFAEHDISGEVARIGEITLRACASSLATAKPLRAETPSLRSVK